MESYGWGYVDNWQEQMKNSRASLCLRGFGRTSFHLAETIQLGLLPIHVYDDLPWIPYRAVYENSIGFIATLDSLPGVLHQIANMSDEELRMREAKVAEHAKSHFTFDAVVAHLAQFFLDPSSSDLECQALTPFVDPQAHKTLLYIMIIITSLMVWFILSGIK